MMRDLEEMHFLLGKNLFEYFFWALLAASISRASEEFDIPFKNSIQGTWIGRAFASYSFAVSLLGQIPTDAGPVQNLLQNHLVQLGSIGGNRKKLLIYFFQSAIPHCPQ